MPPAQADSLPTPGTWSLVRSSGSQAGSLYLTLFFSHVKNKGDWIRMVIHKYFPENLNSRQFLRKLRVFVS